SHAHLLLGARYTLLREEFVNRAAFRSEPVAGVNHLLVIMGGTDPWNVTGKVLSALGHLRDRAMDCVIVLGSDHPEYDRFQSMASSLPFPVMIESNVSSMPERMAWADLAVSAAGSTVWELLYMGVPSILVITADNQLQIADYLTTQGLAVSLGAHDQVSPESIASALKRLLDQPALRERMSRDGRTLIDGQGADRVAMYLSGNRIRLRRASNDDNKILWEWANDPQVRSVSFTSDLIPWESHVRWFDSKMTDSSCIIYIAVDSEDVPIGQIRYDLEGNESVVSISIDSRHRGKGYGRDMLELSARRIFQERDIERIHAYIKTDNEASNRVFAKSGYEFYQQETIRGFQANHFVKERKTSNGSVD
ncbi:MAG TPA: bifunctional UDP-2,4-diacetamido-2,4,6-trideoxy-beta-L-altropyranose hydrolase/GNAT family N-acetyltransferase, partial [bacterium]|nr:bifunctional UDP-2,4-diacetamido-2,4,6-trideoxy-beta-L-altropyranose hydrolase/GNAT family N-acetyltransferase [bacterium]